MPSNANAVRREQIRLFFRPDAIVVVDSEGVVAGADEAIDNAVGEVVVGIVRGEAEIDAVEALLFAGEFFKLEVAADSLEPTVVSGGGVLKPLIREV